jgi:hypothetical protein
MASTVPAAKAARESAARWAIESSGIADERAAF